MKYLCGAAMVVLLASCGTSGNPLRAGEGVEPTSTTASTTTTTTTVPSWPDDGRLHRPYTTDEYQPGSISMGSWRVDVAPASLQPRMSKGEAIAHFTSSAAGGLSDQPGHGTVTAYFGLFSGNAPNPSAPDGRLTGSHPIGPVPAWLMVVDGIEIMGSGGSAPSPGSPPTTQQQPTKGYTVSVFSDQDGHDLSGVAITAGTAADTGIQ